MASTEKTVIHLKQLSKFYGKYRGVEKINLKVHQGSVFGFLGPNGAGKTTTISMMMGLLAPTEGSITLFSKDNKQFATENRSKIGYLAGDMALDGGLTGWQELEYLGNLRGSFNKKYIHELADRLQCDLSRKIKTLSRGNRQKVALIAALMHKPELLILDEPTSGLDPLIQAEFNEIIHEHKKAGRTAFVSSHVLSEVQQICDDVAFIHEGRLLAQTSVHEITKHSPKNVSVTISGKLLADFTKLKGAKQVERIADIITFRYNGNPGQLLKFLAGQPMKDLTISDADLEAVFMEYYEVKNAK